MCTVILSLQPSAPVPLLLLGVRDEFTDRAWRPPGRHWAGPALSDLVGGMDEQAGGTWLAVDPARRRMSCLLNGRGTPAAPGTRRTRGELPLLAAGDGAGTCKELADDPDALAAYDPFHLVCADPGAAALLSWDGARPVFRDLEPGTHVLTNAGHAYPRPEVTEPKAVHFGPKFAASRPPGAPGLPLTAAWGEWLTLADGDGLPADAPEAIVARRAVDGGKPWGTTSQTLIGLSRDGLRYDFRAAGEDWGAVPVT
ncbi:MAG: NRDE family protein [Streptosporangiales bacterium]|nr:NRDE family protein [Streptosporangiales bacterium]